MEDIRGFVYAASGDNQFQITTADKICFYTIDSEDLTPVLENVMSNYVGCTQTMFGGGSATCVTYKTNQKSFSIFRRKV